MNTEDTRLALLAVCDAVLDSEELLTEADMAIGDGDHGIGMSRGFGAAKRQLDAKCFNSVTDCLKCGGFAVISKSGGASGAIFGTFWDRTWSHVGYFFASRGRLSEQSLPDPKNKKKRANDCDISLVFLVALSYLLLLRGDGGQKTKR